MRAFPFSEAEWSTLREAALPLVNATIADDLVLRASQQVELNAVLARLRECHGDHPVLLETEADFIDDPRERIALYDRAKRIALANGLPILSICISLARVFLDDMNQPERARAEMVACQKELAANDDGSQNLEWSRLMHECEIILRSGQ